MMKTRKATTMTKMLSSCKAEFMVFVFLFIFLIFYSIFQFLFIFFSFNCWLYMLLQICNHFTGSLCFCWSLIICHKCIQIRFPIWYFSMNKFTSQRCQKRYPKFIIRKHAICHAPWTWRQTLSIHWTSAVHATKQKQYFISLFLVSTMQNRT